MKGREETVQQRTKRKRESHKPHEPKPKVPPKPSPARKVRTIRGIPVSISGVTVIMSKSRKPKGNTVRRIKFHEPVVLARMAKRAQDSKRPEVQKKLARVALRMEGSRLRKRSK